MQHVASQNQLKRCFKSHEKQYFEVKFSDSFFLSGL